jgi:very-short-patch-repair endonuclease
MHWRKPKSLWEKIKPEGLRMRAQPTPAEAALWDHLRDRRLAGLKFRRQHYIGRFIVDFYCAEAELVVEVDGPVHESQREHDAAREEFLESLGLRVVRFANEDVISRPEEVLRTIVEVASPPAFGHPLSARGEGDGGRGSYAERA